VRDDRPDPLPDGPARFSDYWLGARKAAVAKKRADFMFNPLKDAPAAACR
jgi:hypothetical protein